MEPVSLAVGITGLAGLASLFNTCLDAVVRVQSYNDFKDDSQTLDVQFNAEKLRFEKWGQAVGLDPEKLPADHHHALDDPDTFSAVQDLLRTIHKIYNANGISPRRPFLAGTQLAKDGLFSASHARPSHGAPSESKRRKLAWALGGKEERADQVKLFRELVQQLHDLVPPDGAKSTRPIRRATGLSSDAPVPLQGVSSSKGNWPAELQQILDHLEEKIKAETRRELHAWLLGRYSPNDLYDDATQKRLDGTCEWILHRPIFLYWLSPAFPAKTAKLLWINGPAGFGKTILCTRIIEHLLSVLPEPVAHFFFSSDFESRGDPYVAIRSWISQVVSQDAGAFDLVRKRWEAEQEQVATRASVVKLFREILMAVPGCTLVVDGLDECTSLGDGSKSVARFLETVRKAVEDTTTRVLVISRNEAEIRNALTDTTSLEFLEYKISPEDVRADTASYSRSIVDRKLPNKDEATRSDVSRRMADRCEGQFLWLKMQEDYLRKGKNKKQLEDAIASTPAGLERLYDRSWERITCLQGNDRARAVSLLRWAASALRPLTVCEITEAVLIDENYDDFPIDELPDSVDQAYIDSEISGLCGPLLEVRHNPTDPSPELGTVHLAHFSVKQYLLCNITARGDLLANEILRASNEAIESTALAKLCLRYINFRRVWQGTPEDRSSPFGMWFRDYAAGSWYHHAIAGVADDAATNSLVNALFDMSNPTWDSWRRYFDENDEGLAKDEAADEASPPNPLYYASRLGLTTTLKYLLTERKYDAKSTEGRMALGTSCERGNVEVVKLLLENGADLTITKKDGWTPLHAASVNGHVEVVKLLLEKGADVTTADNNGNTPLLAASATGRVEVVKLLLENGADATIASNNGWTPLNSASDNGHVEVVKLLLENGADVSIADSDGWTPLGLASGSGHVEVVKLLLENESSITVTNKTGRTPLYTASWNGHIEVVKLLLEKGANGVMADNSEWRPIHAASENGHIEVFKLLLEKGTDVTIASNSGWTPMHGASQNGHLEVVKLLIEKGADVTIASNSGWTPMHVASQNGRLEVVKLLIENGANVTIADRCGWTPMHVASQNGHLEVVQLLLATPNIEADRTDNHSRTPLFMASRWGHHAVVQLLLADCRISPEATDWYGSTSLFAAVRNGHVEAAKSLLVAGAVDSGTEVQDGFGRSLQWWAHRTGNSQILQLLAEPAKPVGNPIYSDVVPIDTISIPFDAKSACLRLAGE
ncbi:hypothetical protein DL771_006762 [Monosporascus sp. 5C6A]|nr:hypothetical protein DL771_006762 [Monosporascus sp. 5C6A]